MQANLSQTQLLISNKQGLEVIAVKTMIISAKICTEKQ